MATGSSIDRQTSAISTSSSTVRSRSLRSPSQSLRSRLPWLDGNPEPKKADFGHRKGAARLKSESQTKLLSMAGVQSTPYKSFPTGSSKQTRGEDYFSGSPTAPTIHLDSIPRRLQVSSSQEPNSPQPRSAEFNTDKARIQLSMKPTTSSALRPKTVETPVLNAKLPKRSLIDSIYARDGPPSPILEPNPNDSLPESDTSPLTRAITHLEGLMKEAEGLVNEAANSGHSSKAEEVIYHGNEAIRMSAATAADMVDDLAQRRPFLVDASVSELSLDDYETSNENQQTPFHEQSFKEPIIRDFAYPQLKIDSRKRSEHWLGHRPTKTVKSKLHTHGLENTKNERFDRKAHTAYVTESPPSPPSQGSNQLLRNRRRNVQIVEEHNPKWKEWANPRHNTYFDDAWQPDMNRPPTRSRKASVTPIPWNERTNRKRSHVKLSSGVDVNKDVEKSGSAGGGIGGRFKRRWQLGHTKDEPIARIWSPMRKRISALVACMNTGMVGYAIGDYAGMVPRIQFQLADQAHDVLLGNVYLFLGMAITTFFCWPLPLLHGRRPYILASLGLAIPLQFPQAILVSQSRTPVVLGFELGLLTSRFATGLLLGLTNINDFAILLDLFGASLQSECPHQEIVTYDDPRREGSGIGVWLGIWAWCWVGSVSVGFMSGAGIINNFNPEWGFYISVGLMVSVLLFNVLTPETRHSSLRRTLWVHRHEDKLEEHTHRRVARGEIKLHIKDEGPQFWFQELWAGVILSKRMFFQRGFSIISLYLGWIYGQNILVIVLLGALLSREYKLPSRYVGLGVLSIAIGALLAVPMTYAGLFSRARKTGPRTDSMTFEPQVTWTSHMVRRITFMLMLPIVGIIYAFTSPGNEIHYMIPIVLAGVIGFFDSLAVAECYGLIMESFDTSDLQPGVNSRPRPHSLPGSDMQCHTNYSSFPRVSAGIFISQTFGFLFAAAATGVGGVMTRNLGAQYSTGITAGILMFLTLLLTGALLRYKSVQVIPNHAFGTRVGTFERTPEMDDPEWKPVIIGNPSGKVRRMNLLELGRWSRWTEIRRLNKLL